MDWEKTTGFATWSSYASGLIRTPQRIRERAFKRASVEDQMAGRKQVGEMKKVMGITDVIMLGVTLMLGAGIFVTTGQVAVHITGPAVILSYLIAGVAALLSCLCYAEFSANMPLSGGTYSYISAVFGEFLAWITVSNLVFEYAVGGAAVMRGFTPYFAMLINVPEQKLYTAYNGYNVDWCAFSLVLFFMVMLVFGTRESSTFNTVVTSLQVLLVVFIIGAGFSKANIANAQPFLPFGVRSIFNGASIVFFSFLGFDAVATSAEEVKCAERDLPLGILGGLGIVTVIYVLMSSALILMVPVTAMSDSAAFAAAFDYVGMPWARYLVAAGAIFGIASPLGAPYAQSRIIAAVARQHLLPPVLALVHPRFGTPWVATIVSGVSTAVIALFTDFQDLTEMVSISTLFAFWMVGLALLWYRYYKPGSSSSSRRQTALLVLQLVALVAASVGEQVFTIFYFLLPDDHIGLPVAAAVAVAATASLYVSGGQGSLPKSYAVPLFPIVPAFSVALNTFLLGQLGVLAYVRFGAYTAAVTAVYLLYSMHASADHSERLALQLPQQQGGVGGSNAELVAGIGKRDDSTVEAAAGAARALH